MNRWIPLALLPAALIAACAAPEPPAPPNIILIIGDDHGWPHFGFMGDEIVATPHLDALAQEGVVFPFGFTTSSHCRPSLRSLLTGLHPEQWHARREALRARGLDDDAHRGILGYATLPRLLAEQGYSSFQGGKYWESSYAAGGFSSGMRLPTTPEMRLRFGPRLLAGADGLALGRTTMTPLWEFLATHRDGPFFVWLAPMLPHTPHDAPATFRKPYENAPLSDSTRGYYANITRFDSLVGRLMARLDGLGLRDNTLVVYLSDNGWDQDLQAPSDSAATGGPKGKLSLHELGFRTPILISWPGRIPGGRRRTDLVSGVDLFATLLDVAGVAPPPDRTGISLRSALLEDGEFSREAVIGSMRFLRPPPQTAATAAAPVIRREETGYFFRNASWRYLWYPEAERYGDRRPEELFRIDEDPMEERNVVDQHPELARKFRAEILRWREAVIERTKSAN